ncbi:MAG: AI-2E family transporter [Chloroflexi bacterium]|nr:AI-2E family transporter [Chloroflexota bacterium]
MIDFILRPLRALWGATLGRFFRPAEPRRLPVVIPERREPRSIAGIALRVTLVVAAVTFGVYLAWQLRQLLILAFLAVLFAAALHGPTRFFERLGWPRVLSVVTVYLLLIAGFAIVVALIFPPLINQAVGLADDLPQMVDDLRGSTVGFIDAVAGTGSGEQVVDGITRGAAEVSPDWGALIRLPLTVAGVLLNIVLVLFLSVLMLLERDNARGWFMKFIAREDQPLTQEVSRNALQKLGAYVRGQLLIMTITGVGTLLGMIIINVPFAFPLALLAFIGEAIPMAGAFIAGGPIVLLALLQSPGQGLLMLIWIVVMQQLQGFIVVPLVQSRAVQLSPVVVLLSVLAGASLGGIVGAIIAIPVVAVADVVIRDVVFPVRRAREARRGALVGASGSSL